MGIRDKKKKKKKKNTASVRSVILSLPLIQEAQLSVSRERNVHNTG